MKKAKESVFNPPHYGGASNEHEVIKCLRAWGLESDALVWNTGKYIARAYAKGDPTEQLGKACWYLVRRLAILEGRDPDYYNSVIKAARVPGGKTVTITGRPVETGHLSEFKVEIYEGLASLAASGFKFGSSELLEGLIVKKEHLDWLRTYRVRVIQEVLTVAEGPVADPYLKTRIREAVLRFCGTPVEIVPLPDHEVKVLASVCIAGMCDHKKFGNPCPEYPFLGRPAEAVPLPPCLASGRHSWGSSPTTKTPCAHCGKCPGGAGVVHSCDACGEPLVPGHRGELNFTGDEFEGARHFSKCVKTEEQMLAEDTEALYTRVRSNELAIEACLKPLLEGHPEDQNHTLAGQVEAVIRRLQTEVARARASGDHRVAYERLCAGVGGAPTKASSFQPALDVLGAEAFQRVVSELTNRPWQTPPDEPKCVTCGAAATYCQSGFSYCDVHIRNRTGPRKKLPDYLSLKWKPALDRHNMPYAPCDRVPAAAALEALDQAWKKTADNAKGKITEARGNYFVEAREQFVEANARERIDELKASLVKTKAEGALQRDGLLEQAAMLVDKIGTPKAGATHEELNDVAIEIRALRAPGGRTRLAGVKRHDRDAVLVECMDVVKGHLGNSVASLRLSQKIRDLGSDVIRIQPLGVECEPDPDPIEELARGLTELGFEAGLDSAGGLGLAAPGTGAVAEALRIAGQHNYMREQLEVATAAKTKGDQTPHQLRVERMMRGFGQAVPSKPLSSAPDDMRVLRARLIMEGCLETIQDGLRVEVNHNCGGDVHFGHLSFEVKPGGCDVVELADGVCGLSVVSRGTLSVFGIKDAALLREVDANILAEIDTGKTDEYGKFVKHPDHQPPDIVGILRAQGWGGRPANLPF